MCYMFCHTIGIIITRRQSMDQKKQILQNRISPGIMYFGLLPGKHASYNVSGKKREIKSY